MVTLTREGRSLLIKDGDLPKDQKVYAGLVKPREVEHDSQIYRAYRKEADRIEGNGGTNLRVRLDYEIKADVQKAIYRERKADPTRGMTTIHANGAEDALRRLAQLAMRGSGGVHLRDVEDECRRSIDVVAHVTNQDGGRHITEIRAVAFE